MTFEYKKVLVIGATSGIGKALSERLVQNGVSIIITGRRKEKLDEFVKQHGADKVQAKVIDIMKIDEVCHMPLSLPEECRTQLTMADPPIRL